jgi:hypothetical protein
MPSNQQEGKLGNFLIKLSLDLRLSLIWFVVEVYPVNSFLFIAGAMDDRF